jgi:hypothetical protein
MIEGTWTSRFRKTLSVNHTVAQCSADDGGREHVHHQALFWGGLWSLENIIRFLTDSSSLRWLRCRHRIQFVPLENRHSFTMLHLTYALHAVGLVNGGLRASTVIGSFIFGWPSIIAVVSTT